MKLSQLESELLLIWFRANMTPEQNERLKEALPRAHSILVSSELLRPDATPAANLNAQPVRRPSARRVR